MLSHPSEHLVPDTLLKAASDAVAAAVSTKFPLDELLGAELSRLISISSSVVKRHGILLEKACVEALGASGRFEVLHNSCIPITAAADGLIASNSPRAWHGSTCGMISPRCVPSIRIWSSSIP